MRFGSRGPIEFPECSSRIRHRNALTEKAWEDAVHGQGNLISYPDKQSETWVRDYSVKQSEIWVRN